MKCLIDNSKPTFGHDTIDPEKSGLSRTYDAENVRIHGAYSSRGRLRRRHENVDSSPLVCQRVERAVAVREHVAVSVVDVERVTVVQDLTKNDLDEPSRNSDALRKLATFGDECRLAGWIEAGQTERTLLRKKVGNHRSTARKKLHDRMIDLVDASTRRNHFGGQSGHAPKVPETLDRGFVFETFRWFPVF